MTLASSTYQTLSHGRGRHALLESLQPRDAQCPGTRTLKASGILILPAEGDSAGLEEWYYQHPEPHF